MINRKTILITLILFLATACTNPVNQTAMVSITSPSPIPSQTRTVQAPPTLVPATPTMTIEPFSGLANWQINVRSGPGIYFTLLGQINQGESIQIIGVDPSGEWLAILFDKGNNGQAWVSKEFVQSSDPSNLPVIGLVTLYNGTPAPQANLSQKLNVRSGPGTHYETLGILPANSTIWLTGRNEDSSWFMIDYPSGQGGIGWVIAGFVTTQDAISIPLVDSSGNPLMEAPNVESVLIQNTPTPFYSIARNDHDSFMNPSISVEFSPMGSRQFSYSSNLSYPEGDHADWIEFRPYGPQNNELISVSVSLSCIGNGSIDVRFFQTDNAVEKWGNLTCGMENQSIILTAGFVYKFQLEIIDTSESSYVGYTITIESILK